MISIYWALAGLVVVWGVLFFIIWALQGRIKELMADLKDTKWQRDEWKKLFDHVVKERKED